MSALSVRDIGISFGGVKAVDTVSFDVEEGSIFSIIGPNGAGKTTLFNLISGVYVPMTGSVSLFGEDVTSVVPEGLVARGLSRTFQNLQIFFRMTVAENVMVGRHLKEARGILPHLLALPSVVRQNRDSRAEAIRLLEAERVPVAPVLSVEDVVKLPHARLRRTVRTIFDRALGAFDVPGMPLRFSAFPDELPLQAPFLGEHNAEVLGGLLGYDAARIGALQTQSVLLSRQV